jgi:hypothetical protein
MLTAAAAALTCALCAGPASATQTYKLRVEGQAAAVDPGTHYALPSTTAANRGSLNAAGTCVESGSKLPVAAGSALGLLVSAAEANPDLRPVVVAEDPFGKRVCSAGGLVERDTPFSGWLFRYNHLAPPLSAELVAIGASDEILWSFADFGNGTNTGEELVLDAPVRSTPGSVAVTVRAISFDGNVTPAPNGTVILGGASPATTVGGSAAVPVAEGETELRAVGPGAAPTQIPSEALSLCVDSDLGDCPAKRGRRVIGTNEKDGLKGTGGPDTIRSRGGADKIRVKGGDRDVVNCGRGRDTVIADGADKLRRCETVRGVPKKGDDKK